MSNTVYPGCIHRSDYKACRRSLTCIDVLENMTIESLVEVIKAITSDKDYSNEIMKLSNVTITCKGVLTIVSESPAKYQNTLIANIMNIYDVLNAYIIANENKHKDMNLKLIRSFSNEITQITTMAKLNIAVDNLSNLLK